MVRACWGKGGRRWSRPQCAPPIPWYASRNGKYCRVEVGKYTSYGIVWPKYGDGASPFEGGVGACMMKQWKQCQCDAQKQKTRLRTGHHNHGYLIVLYRCGTVRSHSARKECVSDSRGFVPGQTACHLSVGASTVRLEATSNTMAAKVGVNDGFGNVSLIMSRGS